MKIKDKNLRACQPSNKPHLPQRDEHPPLCHLMHVSCLLDCCSECGLRAASESPGTFLAMQILQPPPPQAAESETLAWALSGRGPLVTRRDTGSVPDSLCPGSLSTWLVGLEGPQVELNVIKAPLPSSPLVSSLHLCFCPTHPFHMENLA